MEELVEGEAQRAASVFEDRGSATTAQAADILAVTTANENPALSQDDDDDDFDVVDAIMEAPAEFVADSEVSEAFESILQSNGFEANEIEIILGQQAQVGVEAQSGLQDESAGTGGEPIALASTNTTVDANEGDADLTGDGTAQEADGVDAELLENAQQDAGVEAQSGATENTDTTNADGAGNDAATENACAAMDDTNDSGDDATAADGDNTTTDDVGEAGADTDNMTTADTNPGGCDLDSIDWFTPGENGISKLGEVVQAFQMLVAATGDKMPILAQMDFCNPTPPCLMDEMMNDMATDAMDGMVDPTMGTDDDMG